MGETDWGGNWVLFWWAGPCSVNLYSAFLLVWSLPVTYLRANYVGVMKIMVASFKRSHAPTAPLSSPHPATVPHRPPPPPGTPGLSRQVWVSHLWGHCSFLLGPGVQGSVCALQESVSLVPCKFCVGVLLSSLLNRSKPWKWKFIIFWASVFFCKVRRLKHMIRLTLIYCVHE